MHSENFLVKNRANKDLIRLQIELNKLDLEISTVSISWQTAAHGWLEIKKNATLIEMVNRETFKKYADDLGQWYFNKIDVTNFIIKYKAKEIPQEQIAEIMKECEKQQNSLNNYKKTFQEIIDFHKQLMLHYNSQNHPQIYKNSDFFINYLKNSLLTTDAKNEKIEEEKNSVPIKRGLTQ